MEQSYQLYMFILSTTTLFTDIKSMDDISHNWFDAQDHCLGRGLTIEENINDQPYWTGVYRRLSPWINILGCYPDSIESLQNVAEKTMIISSVGMCQEMCYQENTYKFAVKMNKCLCFERNINVNPSNRLAASNCNFECEDKIDDIYSADCGGEGAYNIYETQRVPFDFNLVETCLSLQCSPGDRKFIPKKCSTALEKICENITIPNNNGAGSWDLSMEQCRNSQPSTYLLGDFNLNSPQMVCVQIPIEIQLFWVGVARHVFPSIDQGWEIKEEQVETFLECQMCERNNCKFIPCSNLLFGSIFCKSISDTSQSQITEYLTTSHGSFSASTLLSNHPTSEEPVVSTSTTKNYHTDQLASTNVTQQMPSTSDDLVLKISLPLSLGFIVLSISAVGVLYFTRRFKATKTDRTTKVEVESEPRRNIDFDIDYVQNDSYFVLERCSQYITKGIDTSNESPYNNSQDGIYDLLRDKKSRKPDVEDTYQHASAGVSRDMSEYDTMANVLTKTEEEDASYDYSHQDTNENYGCDLRANNLSIDNPYDATV